MIFSIISTKCSENWCLLYSMVSVRRKVAQCAVAVLWRRHDSWQTATMPLQDQKKEVCKWQSQTPNGNGNFKSKQVGET